MKVLLLACSLRRRSINKALAAHTAKVLAPMGVEIDHAMLGEFALPLFDQDIIDDAGGVFPAPAEALRQRFLAADAFIIVTPEYNYSVAAPTKNMVDWLSRFKPMPFRGKPGYLMATSIGPIGGIRGLWQTRIPFEGCGAVLWPDMFALPFGDKKMVGDVLDDADLAARLVRELAAFLQFASKVSGAPVAS